MSKLLFYALTWLAAGSAAAQIAPTSPAQQRAANRQALREAQRANVPYKESHLTVTRQQLQRGQAGGPPGVNNAARSLPSESQRRKGLRLPRLHRAKTEPAS